MVIKIDKFVSLIFMCILIGISFVFAMKSERKDSTASAEISARLPVIMYHHITTDKSKASNYTVTTDEFESDMKLIVSKGYSAVSVSELIDYVYSDKKLPEKSILITFDDGFESYQTLALPIMARYNIKSTVFIIGSATDLYTRVSDHNINYSNLNWMAVKELEVSPICEIGSHTYDLHHNEKGERKGMSKMGDESSANYEKAIKDDLTKLQKLFEDNDLKTPDAIAYPYGAYNNHTTDIIKNLGFKASFTCEERINNLTPGKPDCLYNLGRYNRKSGISSENFFKNILV